MNDLIVAGLNRYIELDKERVVGLDQIKGKLISLHLRELNKTLLLRVGQHCFQQELDLEIEANVEISVSLKILPEFLMGVEQDKLIKNGGIEIKGDAHIASVFQNTLREIEIDWEEILSKYTGDAVAYQLGRGAKSVQSIMKQLNDNMRQDIRDYLQDNIQASATKGEVEQFIQGVDKVRAQTDRLEARLNRLKNRN
ncbi:MAG: SCP2 sterol-binding domain-containing protein [Gammaproteobacteria bacterium]|nr:SCP2 sterol-binding domain-containing protein [Gammaproteobacteria bacterium]